MGRMRENPRYNVISMRVSDEEREQLESLVRRTHKSVSDIMREAMEVFTLQLERQEMRKAAYPAVAVDNHHDKRRGKIPAPLVI